MLIVSQENPRSVQSSSGIQEAAQVNSYQTKQTLNIIERLNFVLKFMPILNDAVFFFQLESESNRRIERSTQDYAVYRPKSSQDTQSIRILDSISEPRENAVN